MHLYCLKLFLTIPLCCNMIPCLFQLKFCLTGIYFSLALFQAFRFLRLANGIYEFVYDHQTYFRGSLQKQPPEVLEKVFLEILQNSQDNNFIKKEAQAQVFYCDFCKISKNIFFCRTPLGDYFCLSMLKFMSIVIYTFLFTLTCLYLFTLTYLYLCSLFTII